MKLLQMLKLTKLRKSLSRRDPISKKQIEDQAMEDAKEMSHKEKIDELIREGKISDMLQDMMTQHRTSWAKPCPSSSGRTISFGQLGEFRPTQVRNLTKCFVKELYGRSGASDQTLEQLLVEFGGGDVIACRKASPTILITKRPGYSNKKDGQYTGGR